MRQRISYAWGNTDLFQPVAQIIVAAITAAAYWLLIESVEEATMEVYLLVIAASIGITSVPVLQFGYYFFKHPTFLREERISALENEAAKSNEVIGRLQSQIEMESAPQHDVNLIEAINYIVTRDWQNPMVEVIESPAMNINGLHKATEAIQQKAADGELTIYGWSSHRKSGPLVSVPQDHWRYHGFEIMSYFESEPTEMRTAIIATGGRTRETFSNLHTSKSKVTKFWPEK